MMLLAIFQNIGILEVGIVLLFALLVFGRRLPELGRSLGQGIVEFRKSLKGSEEQSGNGSPT